MKNILSNSLETNAVCYGCNLTGFLCTTPSGADYTTCPCCRQMDFKNESAPFSNPMDLEASGKLNRLFWADETVGEPDIRLEYEYCRACKIIFDAACIHAENGCTSSVYHAHFIASWKNIETGVTYENGMPQFDDACDWFENAPKVKIIRMMCTAKQFSATCKHASYFPNSTDPEHYGCSLTE